jgi:acetyltransferase-like isoleucine patch superfamily enzyme
MALPKIETPIYLQEMVCRGIEISDDLWISAGATILDGMKIGKGGVNGACAVFSKDVPENAVVGGATAKIIKSRKEAQCHKLCSPNAC